MRKSSSFLFFIFFITLFCNGQKSLINFNGNLLFKEYSYYAPLTRLHSDTLISYSSYEVKDMIEISQITALNFYNNDELNYVPIKFYSKKDTIFFKYADPFDKDHDTTYTPLFTLWKNDTLLSKGCYKIKMDTIRWSDKKTLEIKTEYYEDFDNLNSIRSNDTTIYFKDYKLDCYKIIQFKINGHYKNIQFTRILLVEKHTLIPIDIKEYNFYGKSVRYIRNIPKETKLLTKHQKLISIN